MAADYAGYHAPCAACYACMRPFWRTVGRTFFIPLLSAHGRVWPVLAVRREVRRETRIPRGSCDTGEGGRVCRRPAGPGRLCRDCRRWDSNLHGHTSASKYPGSDTGHLPFAAISPSQTLTMARCEGSESSKLITQFGA